MNVNKLKGKMVEKGLNVTMLANELGIDRATLYRKLNNKGATLTIREANRIAEILDLTGKEAVEIFFKGSVAWNATNPESEVINVAYAVICD